MEYTFTLGIASDINGAEEMAHQIKAFVTHVWWKENQLHKLVLCLHVYCGIYTPVLSMHLRDNNK